MSTNGLPPALGSEELDRLGHAVIALARELWVTRDRLRVLEYRLGELGVDTALDEYQPPDELDARLEVERRAFVEDLLHTLAGISPPADEDGA